MGEADDKALVDTLVSDVCYAAPPERPRIAVSASTLSGLVFATIGERLGQLPHAVAV